MGPQQFPGICQRHGTEAKLKTILYFVYVSPHSSTAYRASFVEFPFQSTPVCLNGIDVPSGVLMGVADATAADIEAAKEEEKEESGEEGEEEEEEEEEEKEE
nr:unnamed protein product [Spirometra erinaceieuropaei]